MADNKKEKQKLKRFVRSLEKIRGRHTELVSVYVPAGYDLIKIIQHLQQEQGTASNIKDKTTQTHVVDSLEKMIRHLRTFKKNPKNGLAIFSGNVSDKEGKVDIQVFSVEPPQPMKMRLYRCDQKFVLDVLKEMVELRESYGILVLDKRDADVGLLKGTSIIELKSMHSAVPGKTKAGGQCLHPDSSVHLADGQIIPIEEIKEGDEVLSYDFNTHEFVGSKVLKKWEEKKNKIYKIKAGDSIIESSEDHVFFLSNKEEKAAKDLEEGMELLNDKDKGTVIESIYIEEKEIPLIDIEVEKKNFVVEGLVVHNSAQRFARIREEAAKDFFGRIADAANKAFLDLKEMKGILVGGPGMTKNTFLDKGYLNEQLKRKVISVQDLSYTGSWGMKELVEKSSDILSDELIITERKIMSEFFKLLSQEANKVVYGEAEVDKALEMGAVDKLLLSEALDDDMVERYEDKAEETGAEVILISTETSEGAQLKDIGRIAAILRFALN
ncbi:MAG: hypothetical protein ISS01_01755 [Nanoarchaeota archaeon]|nr:hypothetical protein [Nanoarchaeota archaeon]